MIISTCKFIFTKLILADKPTVDSQNGKEVMDLLKEQEHSEHPDATRSELCEYFHENFVRNIAAIAPDGIFEEFQRLGGSPR